MRCHRHQYSKLSGVLACCIALSACTETEIIKKEQDAEWLSPLAQLNNKYNLLNQTLDVESIDACTKDLNFIKQRVRYIHLNTEPWSEQSMLAMQASSNLDMVSDVLSFLKSSKKHKPLK